MFTNIAVTLLPLPPYQCDHTGTFGDFLTPPKSLHVIYGRPLQRNHVKSASKKTV